MNNNGGPPVEDPDPNQGLAPEIADVIRRFVSTELTAILNEHLPVLIRNEVRTALPQIEQAIRAGGTPAQSPSPEQNAASPQSSNPLGALLNDPTTVMDLVERGLDKYFQFQQTRAMLNIDNNPIAMAQYIQGKWPMVMNMFAPNPWGDGFQQMMANSYDFGGKIAWDHARKVLKYSRDLEDKGADGTPIAGLPSGSGGLPGSSVKPPEQQPPSTGTPTTGTFTKYGQEEIDLMLLESLNR